MTKVDEIIDKTIRNRRGYLLGMKNGRRMWQTIWDIDTFDNEYLSLIHYGTLILKVRLVPELDYMEKTYVKDHQGYMQDKPSPELREGSIPLEWGGWSPSDRDYINYALKRWGCLDAQVSGGIGGWSGRGRTLQFYYKGIPRNKDMTPSIDIETFKKSIKSLLKSYQVKMQDIDTIWVNTDRRWDGEKVPQYIHLNPRMKITILDHNGELDRYNGRQTGDMPKNPIIIRWELEEPQTKGTRLIFKTQDRIEMYPINYRHHNTIEKALKFITRNADYRQGDVCFKKVKRIPLFSRTETQWFGRLTETAICTHLGSSFSIEPNRDPHKLRVENVLDNIGVVTLAGETFIQSTGPMVLTHKEHKSLSLPSGIYRQYLVHGLTRSQYTRRGD